MKVFCNPLNLSYRYQHYGRHAHREAADPTLVYFKKMYYIFASMSTGFYYSKDIVTWKYHEDRNLQIYHYAPDAHVRGDYLYFCASSRPEATEIWRTADPFSNIYEKVSAPFESWDPALFFDEDNRAYYYYGSSNSEPLYGVEMDSETMLPIGTKMELYQQDYHKHGWERLNYPGNTLKRSIIEKVVLGLMNIGKDINAPYLEGAFMSKFGGKYYLQYAAPATEVDMYSDGTCIGESPLGPFFYQKHNPISSVPSGFIRGAGHGSTIEDEDGNLWHTSTMKISKNANFERRIGLFPAGIDEDGILFCNQNYADYPYQIPDGKFDIKRLKPAWMLLSYKKKAYASSSMNGHSVDLALNEDITNWWCAEGSSGEWYCVDMEIAYEVCAIQINLADENVAVKKVDKSLKAKSIREGYRYIDEADGQRIKFRMEGSVDNIEWDLIKDNSQDDTDLPHDFIVLDNPKNFRYIRITSIELPYDEFFAISGFRIFGKGAGDCPKRVKDIMAQRTDALSALLTWKQDADVMGYNIRYGIAPDKLYSSYLVYEKGEALLTTLNAGQDYWCTVEAFNENGISEVSEPIKFI